MSVFKSQFSRALPIITGPDAVIPSPYVLVSGVTTDYDSNFIIDDTKDFSTLGIGIGDVVYNTSDGLAATVIGIKIGSLVLNANIFASSGLNYIVYQQSPQTGFGNGGCNIWVDASTNLTVITLGQDEVTFLNVPGGSILPVQVIQVIESTAAENLIALW